MAKNTTQKTNALGLNLDPETFKKEVAREQEAVEQESNEPTYTDTYTHTDTYIEKETRSRRTNGMVKPSVWEKISAHAKAKGTSFNDIVCELLDEYIEKHGL